LTGFLDPRSGCTDFVELRIGEAYNHVVAVEKQLDLIALLAQALPAIAVYLPTSQLLTKGSFVNIFLDGSIAKLRLADANYPDRSADGFIVDDVNAGVPTLMLTSGLNTAVVPTAGGEIWLSTTTPGGYSFTPPDPTNPANAGKLMQSIGKAIPGVGLLFNLKPGEML